MSASINFQSILAGAKVAPEVFKLRADYRALLLLVEGIPDGDSDATSEAMLQEAETTAKGKLAERPVTELPHVAAWREAYKSFGAKPNKTRNSLEALTRRVEAGLPRVNRLTDIYNAISVKHQIPLGGEDLVKYSGSPRLIRALGTETFITSSGQEHADAGEVVWVDDEGVTCRRWNWRQGPRTALSDKSRNVLFILDALEPLTDDALTVAADELSTVLKSLSPGVSESRRLITASSG
ncbi:hypothetical protein AMS68_002371 [Peltaster fructicola]|uniref:B3/B4 tRNA-binding domain-containing protein n=1 Tax=Peltaster fructicola TaxID=286661 RepID=A0A6H0XQ42_9PEZI|nr:hypothetical protein AMS68_002371 [Peltaster fructicola]